MRRAEAVAFSGWALEQKPDYFGVHGRQDENPTLLITV
ncbi:hypothetical protein X756_03300 [Mesorhizobium sp. LSHC412B00]|nr:hypothetical protein X756_03300 [Mesorhizobium sp. LSHC412B00]